MLRIYDDAHIRRRFTLKRAQMLMLFAGGTICGLWLAHNGGAVAVADAASAVPTSRPVLTTRWCGSETATGLRFDCKLATHARSSAEGS